MNPCHIQAIHDFSFHYWLWSCFFFNSVITGISICLYYLRKCRTIIGKYLRKDLRTLFTLYPLQPVQNVSAVLKEVEVGDLVE